MAEKTTVDLTTLQGLADAVYRTSPTSGSIGEFDGTHCPRCGQVRRMKLVALFWRDHWAPEARYEMDGGYNSVQVEDIPPREDPAPALYTATCVQCDHLYVLTVRRGPDGTELAALPESYGGLATPNTKPAVAYYLDQAHRSRSVGALSAAAAMYRAALDQLLFHEGFTEGTLGPKIAALKSATPAPPWYASLDERYLEVINALGSGAIHPNDGDIERQETIDAALSLAVDALFAEILDVIYEQPAKRAARLGHVTEAVKGLRKPA